MAGAEAVLPFWVRVPRSEIAYVKFVIESYEHVAVCRTVDAQAGIVVVLAAPDFASEAAAILAALQAEGVCTPVPAPPHRGADLLQPED